MRGSGLWGRLALGACAALAAAGPALSQERVQERGQERVQEGRAVPPLVFTGIPDQDESRLACRCATSR
jgi:phosphonate transport system substrate-binding protein